MRSLLARDDYILQYNSHLAFSTFILLTKKQSDNKIDEVLPVWNVRLYKAK